MFGSGYLSLGRNRVQLNFISRNALNADPVLLQNNTFGARWQAPQVTLQAGSSSWDFR